MNKQTEALKMAIEALEEWHNLYVILPDANMKKINFSKSIKACKEALEQPACKHGVDDGCCKECYMEQTQLAQNSKGFINPEGYKYDYDTGRKK